MQKKNTRFDIVVENLASKFSQIPNFDLTRTDPTVNKLFNMMVFRINDINSYKELVCTKFIPAVQKLVADSKNEISRSKYASLFDKSLVDYNETYYDTVRLSYVGLFHKLENYMNELLQVPEEIFPEAEDSDATVEEWAKKKFNFKIKDWKRFRVTEKINWISNCLIRRSLGHVKRRIPGQPKRSMLGQNFIASI